jgi:putative chitinase
MKILKRGSTGADVKELQTKLKKAGFNPGALDGDFGGGTEAAVIAFQRSSGLLADGIVGAKTLEKLKLKLTPNNDSDTRDIDPHSTPVLEKFTIQVVSKMFPATPISHIKTNLPYVLNAMQTHDMADKVMLLMALSTIRAESEGFVPIDEYKSRYNTSPNGPAFDLYDNRKDLGNKGKPDGANFKGRGYIQLTGRSNYTTYSKKLGLGTQMVSSPSLANNPVHAANILALFLKDKERPIREAVLDGNLKQARKLVNGGSHGLVRFKSAFNIGDALVN